MNLPQKIEQLLEITGTPPDKRDLARKNYARLAQEKGEGVIDARLSEFRAMHRDVAAWRRRRAAGIEEEVDEAALLDAGHGVLPKPTLSPTTVTIKHLAASLAESHEVPKRQAETILNDLVGLLVKHLKKGERIRLSGLGILQVRKRAARIGRNPLTGKPLKIKASRKVAFRASRAWGKVRV
jgi:DNA-binding protein HU-beta